MNAAPLCFGPRARDRERGSDFGPSGGQPNRVGAAFGASSTVALSTARGSMPAMTGPGHAANPIERFCLSYWLDLLFVHRLHGNRCRTKNGIFEAISRFDCYIARLSGEHRSKRANPYRSSVGELRCKITSFRSARLSTSRRVRLVTWSPTVPMRW